MQLAIVAYGNQALRESGVEISWADPQLDNVVDSMWKTMKMASGCGLAAPQIDLAIQLFIVDSVILYANYSEKERQVKFVAEDNGIQETFINAHIIAKSNEVWDDIEGCLSIPDVYKSVTRPWSITIEYYDRYFNLQTKTFYGITARVIQHEYDHTRGVLFIDRLSVLSRKLLNRKLNKIAKGKIATAYKMKF